MARVFLLDRSGSMESVRDDTIVGYNSFVDTQKELGGTISLYQFDHEIVCVYENVPIENVVPLTHDTFVPRGGTALLDAMGTILKKEFPRGTVVVVLTDGDENSSSVYTSAHIKDLIDMRQTRDDWKFIYLGANISDARELGIQTSINYDGTQTPELFASLSPLVSRTMTNQ